MTGIKAGGKDADPSGDGDDTVQRLRSRRPGA